MSGRVWGVLVGVTIATAGSSQLIAQRAPRAADVYREAVANYARSRDPVIAVKPLLHSLTPRDLETAVKNVAASGNHREAENAAMLHLEIALAAAALMPEAAAAHLDLGARLIDALVPPRYSTIPTPAPWTDTMTRVRARWLGVAASVLLSVDFVDPAMPLLAKAARLWPDSAEILTLQATAAEVDAINLHPHTSESASQQVRLTRERTQLLLRSQELCGRALEIAPHYALAWIRLGRAQFLLKNSQKARASLTRGASLAHERSHQYLAAMFMGAVQQDDNDLDGARRSFERAVDLFPLSQDAVVALAYVESVTGRPGRAQTLIQAHAAAAASDSAWWANKNGALDRIGLQWLRERVRP